LDSLERSPPALDQYHAHCAGNAQLLMRQCLARLAVKMGRLPPISLAVPPPFRLDPECSRRFDLSANSCIPAQALTLACTLVAGARGDGLADSRLPSRCTATLGLSPLRLWFLLTPYTPVFAASRSNLEVLSLPPCANLPILSCPISSPSSSRLVFRVPGNERTLYLYIPLDFHQPPRQTHHQECGCLL
jgi:hypothetical protein